MRAAHLHCTQRPRPSNASHAEVEGKATKGLLFAPQQGDNNGERTKDEKNARRKMFRIDTEREPTLLPVRDRIEQEGSPRLALGTRSAHKSASQMDRLGRCPRR